MLTNKDKSICHWKTDDLLGVTFIIPISKSVPSLENTNSESGADELICKIKVEEGDHADKDDCDGDNIELKHVDLNSVPLWRSKDDYHGYHDGEREGSECEDEQVDKIQEKEVRSEDTETKLKNKIRQARRRLRIRLTNSGASPEEIAKEVEKLVERYKSLSSQTPSSKGRTHDEVKKQNRLRQAKRRLKIKLMECGASAEKIEMELSRLDNEMCDNEDEGVAQFQKLEADVIPPFSDGDGPASNFSLILKTDEDDSDNLNLQVTPDPHPLFFPALPEVEESLEDENVEDTLITSYEFSTPPAPRTPRKCRTIEERRTQNRIRQAQRRLRIRLTEGGASPEEIEMELARTRFRENEDISKEAGVTAAQFHIRGADTHFPAFTNFSSQTNELDDTLQANLDPLSVSIDPAASGEAMEEPQVNILELSSEYVYVGRATLDNMVNEGSSEDEDEEGQQELMSQQDPLFNSKQIITRTKSSAWTSEKLRKKREYMRKYRHRLGESCKKDGIEGRLQAPMIVQHSLVEMEDVEDGVQIKLEMQDSFENL